MMEKCYDEGTLQAFLDNELSPELSQSVARHLVDCDPCAVLLAEVEEETAFAFAALEQEFNTLVPTQRLWTKINESIEIQHRKRSVWQTVLGFFSGISLSNPHVIAFGSLLLIVGVVSALIVVRNDTQVPGGIARTDVSPVFVSQPDRAPIAAPPTDDRIVSTPAQVKARNNPAPAYRIEKADYRKPLKIENGSVNPPDKVQTVPQFIDGEENYVETIARLEDTVNRNKDEVLKPAARFSFEKDMAVVNDTIGKLRKEVRKNPKNEDAKQILFASYQNKIELLNSVTQRSELMASLR